VVGFAEVRKPDPEQRRSDARGQHQAGADQQRLVVAAVQRGLDDQRAQDLADPVAGGEDGDGPGDAQVPTGGQRQRGDPDEGGAEQHRRRQRGRHRRGDGG
jgi:hypothetical protein